MLSWTSRIFFAASMSLIPIAIAVSISESYVALAAILGILVNKERLMKHQKIGLVISIASVILLSALYG